MNARNIDKQRTIRDPNFHSGKQRTAQLTTRPLNLFLPDDNINSDNTVLDDCMTEQ
jgi:hypothetical protein